MNIPNKIKIGPFYFDVILDNEKCDLKDANGLIQQDKLKIFIDTSIPIEKQKQTLIHEILHACFYTTGISVRFEDKPERWPDEEDIVTSISTALYQVLNDNKDMFNETTHGT